jgi:O-acetyl-ADP-ribose deacetylase (regulator of RNase III)
MAIIYKQGNAVDALIDGEIDFLLHCANCQNTFGSGIAYEIKKKIPEAYEADCTMSELLRPDAKLGRHSHSMGVINLYGQLNYGLGKRQLNYGALASAIIHSMPKWADENEVVGVPYKMASDRAGGDWNIVLELLTHLVVPYVKDLVIYKL